MTTLAPRRRWPLSGLEVALGLFCLGLYTLTLAPGLLPADAGEYQLAGATLGIAHPPGFALNTLLSWLMARLLFFVSAAVAINWLAALLAAISVVLTYRIVVRLTALPLAGVGAALLLAGSTTFWAQATTANIRMPSAAATLFALDRLLAYRQAIRQVRPANVRWSLALLAFALGLGVAHHASLFWVMAVFGVYALWLRPRALRRPWPLLAGLLPFLTWLYFPLRGPAVGLPRLATLDGFLEHILARGFGGDIFYFANLSALPARLYLFANTLTFEFTWPLLFLIGVGAGALLMLDWAAGLVLLAAVAGHVFVAITYRAPQTVEYLLPAWVLMGVWAGVGIARLWEALQMAGRGAPAWSGLTKALLLVVVLAQFVATYPSYRWLAQDDGTRAYAAGVLAEAPPNATILATWHWSTPLWYLQQVEGQRPDVTVQYVVPAAAPTWVAAIQAALPARPVVVTSFFEPEYRATGYRYVPLGDTAAWQVLAAPLTAPPADLTGAETFGDWEFLGAALDLSATQQLEGAEARVRAAWRTTAAPEPVSVFVHLLGPDGSLHSQQDLSYTADRYVSGEVLLDRYVLPLRPDAPAGTYTLVAGAYRPDGALIGQVTLGTFEWPPAATALRLPPVSAPPGAVPLGNALWLAGWQIDPPGPLRPGDTLTVALDFLAARPLTADDTVKVALIGPNYAWQVASDGTPAEGAIPTLKWIAGARIRDVHRLVIPADALPGEATLAVVVYDAFTQQPLPIMDPALAASGPLLPIGAVTVAP